jgi:hypothetical protein
MKMTDSYLMIAVAGVCLVGGCGHKVQRSPSLVKPPERPVMEEKSFLNKAGDATWDVVSAPARLVAPGKKPAKKEREVYEPAEMVILTPGRSAKLEVEGEAESQPAATEPAGK